MSDDLRNDTPAASSGQPTAGRLLREAREASGLHIAALAIQLKVPPRKLEALEADRHDELLDPTFTRALAQAVCRALKIDAAPVLALLPRRPLDDLAPVASGGINTPFKDRGGLPSEVRVPIGKGPLIALGLIALAVVAVLLAPADLGERYLEPLLHPTPASAPASAAASTADAAVPAAVLASQSLAPAPEAAIPAEPASAAAVPVTAPPPAVAASGALVLSATESSWVQVLDADARPLLIRQLAAGETVSVDSAPPLRLVIGNAAGTRVTWRGQPVDLAARTRDNVARFELTGAAP